jgi:hypothetical protein
VRRPRRGDLALLGRGALILGGFAALVATIVGALGGRKGLWLFERMDVHRFQSMAMLTGTLKLRSGVAHAGTDEQIFNGGTYTSWGYGVALLQMPFHALAGHLHALGSHFFPDHAIFAVYATLSLAMLWVAFDRVLSRQVPALASLTRHFVAWSGALLVATLTVYPLVAHRFVAYEETESYFVLSELVALSAYIFGMRTWTSEDVVFLAVASGVGLLVRPTGLFYLGTWVALVALESRSVRKVGLFALAAAPFMGFWAYTNWLKAGTPFTIGFENAVSSGLFLTNLLRFGNRPCLGSVAHTASVAMGLLKIFFVVPTMDESLWGDRGAGDLWLKKCQFVYEKRGLEPAESVLGPAVLALLLWAVAHHAQRRKFEARLWVPYATFGLLFASYVSAGSYFAWRYVSDFWPLVILILVQYFDSLDVGGRALAGVPLALAMLALSAVHYERFVVFTHYAETVGIEDAPAMWQRFHDSRWAADGPLPSRITCGDTLARIYANGQGWSEGNRSDCATNYIANVFLGVPTKTDAAYAIRFATSETGAATLRVYVNGRVYTAHREGDAYVAPVRIDLGALSSPVVMATVETSSSSEPTHVKLLWIELA